MRIVLLSSMLALAGCETEDCPRGSLLDQQGGLVLTAETHPDGWGEADCAACHPIASIHDVSCTEGVDLEAVRAEVDELGYDGCVDCHGDNGVEP